jgi:hypothetical protein
MLPELEPSVGGKYTSLLNRLPHWQLRKDRNERRTKEHSRQIVDLVLTLDPHLRQLT